MKIKILIGIVIIIGSIFACDDITSQSEENKNSDDITACNVKNPLINLPWLKEYCENLDTQYYSNVTIDLYKVIDEEEFIFQTHLVFPIDDPVQGSTGFSKYWQNCEGEIKFTIRMPGTPLPPERQEKLDEFINGLEYVAELYHFVK